MLSVTAAAAVSRAVISARTIWRCWLLHAFLFITRVDMLVWLFSLSFTPRFLFHFLFRLYGDAAIMRRYFASFQAFISPRATLPYLALTYAISAITRYHFRAFACRASSTPYREHFDLGQIFSPARGAVCPVMARISALRFASYAVMRMSTAKPRFRARHLYFMLERTDMIIILLRFRRSQLTGRSAAALAWSRSARYADVWWGAMIRWETPEHAIMLSHNISRIGFHATRPLSPLRRLDAAA